MVKTFLGILKTSLRKNTPKQIMVDEIIPPIASIKNSFLGFIDFKVYYFLEAISFLIFLISKSITNSIGTKNKGKNV